MKSVLVDWNAENWSFTGARVMEERAWKKLENCPHYHPGLGCCDECRIYPNDVGAENRPMMNYAYPLERHLDDDTIAEVCEETNCTVVHNRDTDEWFLALSAGGMDYSQDIALAYIIADGCIDWDFLDRVFVAHPLSVGKEKYRRVMDEDSELSEGRYGFQATTDLLRTLISQGERLERENDLSLALAEYRRAVMLDSTMIPAWQGLVRVSHRMGRLANMQQELEAALSSNAESPVLWYALGLLLSYKHQDSYRGILMSNRWLEGEISKRCRDYH